MGAVWNDAGTEKPFEMRSGGLSERQRTTSRRAKTAVSGLPEHMVQRMSLWG